MYEVKEIPDEEEEVENEEEDEHEKFMGKRATDYPFFCRSIRIGSYKIHPEAKKPHLPIMLSRNSLSFPVPMVNDTKKPVVISLKHSDIRLAKAHFGRCLPILFVYPTPKCGDRIQKMLSLPNENKAAFDPVSADPKKDKITFFIDSVSTDQQNFMRVVFPGEKKVDEIDQKTANELLAKSTPSLVFDRPTVQPELVRSNLIIKELNESPNVKRNTRGSPPKKGEMKFPVRKQDATERDTKPSKEKQKADLRLKLKKKKRLIIRNLSFKVTEESLKSMFSEFGNVLEVKIPLKTDGKKRGFAFVQFEKTSSLIKAMKTMNYKEIEGRRIAIDYAMDKTSYQLKMQSVKKEIEEQGKTSDITKEEPESDNDSDDSEGHNVKVESESEDENEKRVNKFLTEFDASSAITTNESIMDDDESSSEFSSNDEEETPPIDNKRKKPMEETEIESPPKTKIKRERSEDVNEGKTVFLRNVSFTTSKESLEEAMEEFGELEYCLLCVDSVTGHPRGTAFVKFKEKDAADKLVDESSAEPGTLVDGRRMNCSYAITREQVSKMADDPKKPKDKRNLRLLKVGLIMQNSKESEGVSSADMAKRSQFEMIKNRKLRNVNFFVSDTRLVISNLPQVFSDSDLRTLFKNAAGKGAVVTEARVMREYSKTDSEGKPVTKGFGFVNFRNHEDALKALTELNNSPNVFTVHKRPIVDFSVENKVALIIKDRRRKKVHQRNKRRTEEKKARQSNQE